jgi:hypothetical protein
MIDKVQAIIEEARRRNPDFAHLNDRQILFLLAYEQDGSRIRFIGRRPDGQLKFEIDLPDASDGFHQVH